MQGVSHHIHWLTRADLPAVYTFLGQQAGVESYPLRATVEARMLTTPQLVAGLQAIELGRATLVGILILYPLRAGAVARFTAGEWVRGAPLGDAEISSEWELADGAYIACLAGQTMADRSLLVRHLRDLRMWQDLSLFTPRGSTGGEQLIAELGLQPIYPGAQLCVLHPPEL